MLGNSNQEGSVLGFLPPFLCIHLYLSPCLRRHSPSVSPWCPCSLLLPSRLTSRPSLCCLAEADKAKEKMMAEKLEREKLAGDKDVAGKNYDSESAAYKLVITPYEREIYVITVSFPPHPQPALSPHS